MKVLCVAEKPSIAKAVAQALGGGRVNRRDIRGEKFVKNYDINFNFPDWGSSDVTITSVSGHLMQLDFDSSYRNWSSVDPSELFTARLVSTAPDRSKKIIENIKSEARRSNKVFIWTDCDREGEHIGNEIVSIARSSNRNLRDQDIKRAIFNNVDPGHLRSAATQPANLDMNQVHAVQARIELDLRTGSTFTRFQTLLLQNKLQNYERRESNDQNTGGSSRNNVIVSYGPCQFPTLGFVVDRYKKVKNFVPEDFWYIDITVKKNNKNIKFTWDRGHLFDRMSATLLLESCLESPGDPRIESVNTRQTTKYKPYPLTTVELQKKGAQYLRLTSKKIMDIAEQLYTKGYISYPRTETDQFDEAINLENLVSKQKDNNQWGEYAAELLDGGRFEKPRKGKHNDKAHPPIHPINGMSADSGLRADDKKVYEFITRRFLACCSKDAKGQQTTVKLNYGDEYFTCTGLIVLERNFLDVYPYIKWESNEIPQFNQGEVIEISNANLKEGKTSPPNYLTEPELIALMDANGIGTDATMAEHVEKVLDRGYIVSQPRSGNQLKILIPSKLGMALVKGYDEIGFDLSFTKPFLRKDIERKMTKICQGELTKEELLNQSITTYQNLFTLTKDNKDKLVSSVEFYFG